MELPKTQPDPPMHITASRWPQQPNSHQHQPHLLEQAHHARVGIQVQGQGPRQSFLVLKATGIELGPEFHLQLPELLQGALVLCHTALELRGHTVRLQVDTGREAER